MLTRRWHPREGWYLNVVDALRADTLNESITINCYRCDFSNWSFWIKQMKGAAAVCIHMEVKLHKGVEGSGRRFSSRAAWQALRLWSAVTTRATPGLTLAPAVSSLLLLSISTEPVERTTSALVSHSAHPRLNTFYSRCDSTNGIWTTDKLSGLYDSFHNAQVGKLYLCMKIAHRAVSDTITGSVWLSLPTSNKQAEHRLTT